VTPEQVAALAAVLVPERAPRLLSLALGSDGAVLLAAELARRPRRDRLAAAAAALPPAGPATGSPRQPSWWRRLVHDATEDSPPGVRPGALAEGPAHLPCGRRDPPDTSLARPQALARGVNEAAAVTSLPFELPAVSRGFAALTQQARAEGRRLADAVADALGALLGAPMRIDARPAPGPAAGLAPIARVPIALCGVSATAAIDVDASLLAKTLEHLGAGGAAAPAALRPSALERSLLALLALAAIDAAGAPVRDRLVPRLACEGEAPADSLLVVLDLAVGGLRGRGALLVPPAALRALEGDGGVSPRTLGPASAALRLPASFRRGAISLTWEELAALTPGDVLLLDGGTPRPELVFPGGLTLCGTERGEALHVEEIRMTEAQASYPLTLAVELGRVTLTLGELARIAPGAALPLDLRKDGTVVLRAGERAIARGQLIEIDGALGVRVAELGGPA
jgi:type III secretion protein Q